MSTRTETSEDSAGEQGQQDSGQNNNPLSVTQIVRQLFKVRKELIGLEAKEASGVLIRLLLFLIAAIGASIVAYLCLLCTLAWGINHLLVCKLPESSTAWSIPITTGILMILHMVAAWISVYKLKKKPASPLFEYTRNEWKKDYAWLLKKTSKDKSKHS